MDKESLEDVFPKNGRINQERKEKIQELWIQFQMRLCNGLEKDQSPQM